MKNRKGINTQLQAARFRLQCATSRERAMEFGRETFRFTGLPDCPTLDAMIVQLLSLGVRRGCISHFRGWVCVARLYFYRCVDG